MKQELIIKRLVTQAMEQADAIAGLDQLNALEALVKNAQDNLRSIIEKRADAVSIQQAGLFYYKDGSTNPTNKLQDHVRGLRRGKVWPIQRVVQIDPVFVVCVGTPSDDFENRYRVVDSEETAKGVLLLHNLI
jgi:hypothetical protein